MPEIVTLLDMKEHLGLTDDFGSADDQMITRKIAAAVAHTERCTGVQFADLVGDVPEDLREAVRMLAAHLYENREASLVGVTASTVPYGYDDLVRPHRRSWF